MVSIVLPTYNGEKYLSLSIDSVISQSFSDWELIIVDDCSTDETGRIADEYACRDERIKVIHNFVNQKLPASLNIGFNQAKGELYSWTSDDNIYETDALSEMVAFLEENPDNPMVCASMCLIDADGEECGMYPKYDSVRMYYNACVGACFMYRRESADKVGKYDENLFGIEDYDYWLRILEECGEIGFIDRELYKYRLHEKSLTHTRWISIKNKLNQERTKRFDYLYSKLRLHKNYLSGLYFDMLISDSVTNEMWSQFVSDFPELDKLQRELGPNDSCIIYGAGDFGDKAYDLLGERAKYYADRSGEKIGRVKNSLAIVSPDKASELAKDYCIVIALESHLVYGVVESFFARGVRRITTLQYLIGKQESLRVKV